jgi:hypothetical protein
MRINSLGIEFYEELEHEIYIHCRYHLQLIVSVDSITVLFDVLNRLLKNRRSMELIFYSNSQEKLSIEETNCLLRLANQGALVYRTVSEQEEFPIAIIDKSIVLLSSPIPEAEAVKILAQYKKIFRRTSFSAAPLLPSELDIEIDFWAERDVIGINQPTHLNWKVKNGDYIKIEPNIGEVETSGSVAISITDDTVYTLEARNKKGTVTRNLFLKYVPEEDLRLDVSIFEEDLNQFIPIRSPEGFEGHFAVPYGYKIRIRWNSGMAGKLSSPQIGNLPSTGFRDFEVFQDCFFEFHKRDLFGKTTKMVKFYIVDKIDGLELDPKGNSGHFLFNLWKAIIEMVSTKI